MTTLRFQAQGVTLTNHIPPILRLARGGMRFARGCTRFARGWHEVGMRLA